MSADRESPRRGTGTNPCACRFSSATGEQVVWCVVHDELRDAAAELDRVFEMLDREGLDREGLEHRHGRCVMKIVAGLIGEHAMLRGRLEEVRGLIAADSPDIEQALFRIDQATLATRPRT